MEEHVILIVEVATENVLLDFVCKCSVATLITFDGQK
jgi:hypothetical protein